MLESIINPKNLEKGEWKMFFIGIVYASLSILLVHFFFRGDPVLSKYSGMIVVIFCVMFSLPFMYYLIKKEEKEDEKIEGLFSVLKTHKSAIFSLMWLFIGFVIAFSFWYMILQSDFLFNAQIETFCMINSPGNINDCVSKYSFSQSKLRVTGAFAKTSRFLAILENNVYVMIFTLLFSLIFGAGAIFILAWNASVISAAIGIFSGRIREIPLGLLRYMIHGFPEIAAYFVTALAGGIFGFGALKYGFRNRIFLKVVENVVILLFLSVVLLVVAALIEVYITPILF